MTTQIAYIGGYGRSGSTLVDLLVGSAPGVFGAGEVESFFDELAVGGECSCGQPFPSCEIWKQVWHAVSADIETVGLTTLGAELRSAEATAGLVSIGSKRTGAEVDRAAVWRKLFEALADATGARLIVDSSKSSRSSSRRLAMLHNDPGLDVRVVHLVRDPRAVVYSESFRGNNRHIEAGDVRSVPLSAARTLVGWAMANAAVELTVRRHRDLPVLCVRYEDFVIDPAAALEEIGAFLGVDTSSVIARLQSGGSFQSDHGVGGNRMRRSGTVNVGVDDEWVNRLPKLWFALSRLVAPLAARYGYDMTARPGPIERRESAS